MFARLINRPLTRKLASIKTSRLLITQRRPYPILNPIVPRFHFSSSSRFQSSIFVDPEDNTITLGEEDKEPSYRGSLVIVPTPIGNLGDISLRQYEALTTCDIVACEDTRKTGKMLQLLQDKRVREKFKSEFGVSVEEFMERSNAADFGENVNDLKKDKADQDHEHDAKNQIQQEVGGAIGDEAIGEDLADTKFYLSEEEFNDQRTLNRLQQANQDVDSL